MNGQHASPQQARRLRVFLWLALLLVMTALACNLSGEPPPPTIPPRLPTATPQATIGVSTQVPLPSLPGNVHSQIPSAAGIENLLRQVNTDTMLAHIEALQGFETRHVNSAPNSDDGRGIYAARQYLLDQFNTYAAGTEGRMIVQEHPFSLAWGDLTTMQYNVFAVLNGTVPNAGVVLVSAHYDSTTTAYEDGEAYAPGANDNGSGIAAMLEMARIMSQTPHRATIIFAAFSAEETGRQGSIRFVDEYISQYNIDLRGALTLDIIGNVTGPNGEVNDSQIRVFSANPNNSTSRQLARMMHLVASTYVPDLQVQIIPAEDREGRWGDHLSFSLQGYPAIRIIEAMENRNRQHNAQDTIDQINPYYLTRAARATLAALAVLVDGLPAPDNVTLRDDGSSDAMLVWAPVEGAAGYVIALRAVEGLVFSQVITVGATPNTLAWAGFSRFEAAAIATVDENGRWGPFSRELRIAPAAAASAGG